MDACGQVLRKNVVLKGAFERLLFHARGVEMAAIGLMWGPLKRHVTNGPNASGSITKRIFLNEWRVETKGIERSV